MKYKRRLAALLAASLIALVSCTAQDIPVTGQSKSPEPPKGDFSYSTWGMSKEDVSRVEAYSDMTISDDTAESSLTYKATLYEYDFSLSFGFTEDKLNVISIVSDDNGYQEADFTAIVKGVSKTLGEPDLKDSSFASWDNDRTMVIAVIDDDGMIGLSYMDNNIELPQTPDFRNTTWGMTQEEVKKVEIDVEWVNLLDRENVLTGTAETAGMDSMIAYTFDSDGKLQRAVVLFTESHTSENLYIDDYYEVQEKLTEKYGEPKLDKKIWNDDLYKDDENDWGFAVSIGDLAYGSTWESNATQIALQLKGDNYSCQISILYEDVNNPLKSNSFGL